MKVLLVDDDLDLINITTFALQQAGFLVVRACDGDQAIAQVDEEVPDIVVLDINLPRRNGFEVARIIRQNSALPIIMLTARGEEDDVVRALQLGADDYLTKPFSPKVLVARILALLRRSGFGAENSVSAGRLALDLDSLRLEGAPGGSISLTPLEARFLQLLITQAGKTVPTERLLNHVWGGRAGGNRQLLKQLVHRLRQKLEPDPGEPRYVKTVPNAGYMLDTSEPPGSEQGA
jgi:DNA-binding response OmpR family regulator